MNTIRLCLILVAIAASTPCIVAAQDAAGPRPVDLDRRVSIDVNAVAPAKLLGMLAETLGRELVVKGEFREDITLRASNIKARTALDSVCESVGCQWQIDGGKLSVVVTEPIPAAPRRTEPSVSRSERVYVPGPGITIPKAIVTPKPAYTREALQAKVQGLVTLSVVVQPDGSVGDVKVLTPLHPDLDAEAANTARKWRFTPGTRDGKPVPVQVTLEMNFTLR